MAFPPRSGSPLHDQIHDDRIVSSGEHEPAELGGGPHLLAPGADRAREVAKGVDAVGERAGEREEVEVVGLAVAEVNPARAAPPVR